MFVKYQSALVVNKDVVIHDAIDLAPEPPDDISPEEDVVLESPIVEDEVDDG